MPRVVKLRSRSAALAAVMLAAAASPPLAAQPLTSDQNNLAYCIVVLRHAAYGGERPGENDPGSAGVLTARLSELLKSDPVSIERDILPATAEAVAGDMAAKGRPRFSATACAGYAHFIRTTPLP